MVLKYCNYFAYIAHVCICAYIHTYICMHIWCTCAHAWFRTLSSHRIFAHKMRALTLWDELCTIYIYNIYTIYIIYTYWEGIEFIKNFITPRNKDGLLTCCCPIISLINAYVYRVLCTVEHLYIYITYIHIFIKDTRM